MMIAPSPNSLFCQKEEAQGEKEKEARGRRKGRQIGTPAKGADAPTGPTGRGVGCKEVFKKIAYPEYFQIALNF